eukprot:COSAG06_NODE_3113_length_5840_cov_57.375719_4_plen_287_part_00
MWRDGWRLTSCTASRYKQSDATQTPQHSLSQPKQPQTTRHDTTRHDTTRHSVWTEHSSQQPTAATADYHRPACCSATVSVPAQVVDQRTKEGRRILRRRRAKVPLACVWRCLQPLGVRHPLLEVAVEICICRWDIPVEGVHAYSNSNSNTSSSTSHSVRNVMKVRCDTGCIMTTHACNATADVASLDQYEVWRPARPAGRQAGRLLYYSMKCTDHSPQVVAQSPRWLAVSTPGGCPDLPLARSARTCSHPPTQYIRAIRWMVPRTHRLDRAHTAFVHIRLRAEKHL